MNWWRTLVIGSVLAFLMWKVLDMAYALGRMSVHLEQMK